jgi:tetratricopeptide (TPR) repeat protein
VIAGVLLVLFMVNAVVLTWRYVALKEGPPTTYEEFQIRRWQDQLVANPKDPAVWATLGRLYDEAGNESKARKAYQRALELDPNSAPALLYLARQARREEKYDLSRTYLERALKALPAGGRSLVYFELGELERQAGDQAAAIKAYEASIAEDGSYFNPYQRLAFLYAESAQEKKALQMAEKAWLLSGGEAQDVRMLIDDLRSKGVTYTEEVDDGRR